MFPSSVRAVEMVVKPALMLVLLTLLTIPLTASTVMVFSIFDVFAELESWGRVTLGRFNGSVSAWPIPEVSGQNSLTLEITELRLLDEKQEWIKSHRFDSSSRNFMVSSWEEETYHDLKAHGRRIETIRLGEVDGEVRMEVYILTESGPVTRGDLTVNLNRGDVQIVVELNNVTRGCNECHTVEFVMGLWGRGVPAPLGPGTELGMDQDKGKAVLPHVAVLDESWADIEKGFPKIEQLDTSVSVTVRVPTFESSARYDVTIQPGGKGRKLPPGEGTLSHRLYGVTEETVPEKDRLTDSKTEADINPKYNHVKDAETNEQTNSGVALVSHQMAVLVIMSTAWLAGRC